MNAEDRERAVRGPDRDMAVRPPATITKPCTRCGNMMTRLRTMAGVGSWRCENCAGSATPPRTWRRPRKRRR